jgi:hypothetical protein
VQVSYSYRPLSGEEGTTTSLSTMAHAPWALGSLKVAARSSLHLAESGKYLDDSNHAHNRLLAILLTELQLYALVSLMVVCGAVTTQKDRCILTA